MESLGWHMGQGQGHLLKIENYFCSVTSGMIYGNETWCVGSLGKHMGSS